MKNLVFDKNKLFLIILLLKKKFKKESPFYFPEPIAR